MNSDFLHYFYSTSIMKALLIYLCTGVCTTVLFPLVCNLNLIRHSQAVWKWIFFSPNENFCRRNYHLIIAYCKELFSSQENKTG